MITALRTAERMKFSLLSEGLAITPAAQAYIDEQNHGRPMTPADYATTSGVILRLDGDVWVNAPIATHNPNFVTAPTYSLDLGADGLVVRSGDAEVSAGFWLPPAYHGTENEWGAAYNDYGFTHADRLRISPIAGCAMTCKFCDLPYEFRYTTKRVEHLVDVVRRATTDEVQPAHHVLISGGTPRDADFGYVREVYESVITGFPQIPVDIMMVPLEGLMDARWLDGLGVNELSVNIEIYNRGIARSLMRRKFDQRLDHYLDYLASAAEILGPGRVRSMLLVGIEPVEDTLAGVEAIAQRGCVPVLSPFRADPSTPLRDTPVADAATMEECYLRAVEIAADHGVRLGPDCGPCTHNTLTFVPADAADGTHGTPNLV